MDTPSRASEVERGGDTDPPRSARRAMWAGAAAMLALLLLKISPLTFVDPDLFHQLSLAREIWSTGRVPRVDLFSYTPTIEPLVHHEWGAGMLFLLVARGGGAAGFLLFKYALVAAVVGLTIRAARRRGAEPAMLVTCALVAVLLGHYGCTTIRPQLLSMLALAALLNFLADGVAARWRWIWLPFQLLWTNVHAGFVVGLGFLALSAGERIVRRENWIPHAVLTLVAAGMVLVNPFGVDYPVYLVRGLFMDRPAIPEWAPLWVDLGRRWADLLSWLAMLALAVYAIKTRGLRVCREIPLVAAAFGYALLHQRHVTLLAVTWFAIVPAWLAATPLARSVDAFLVRRTRLVALLGVLSAVVFLGLALVREPWKLRIPTLPNLDGPHYPVGAVDYLREQHFAGNLMTPFVEGGYLMWRLHPQGVRISYDGRYEVAYDAAVSDAHREFYSAGAWQPALAAYPTDVVLIPRSSPVVGPILALPDWRVVYGDDAYILVARAGVELPYTDHRGHRPPGEFP